MVSNLKTEPDPTPANDEKIVASDKTKPGVDGDNEKDVNMLTLEDIRQQVRYIEKAVSTKELTFVARVVRSLPSLRKRLNHNVLNGLVQGYFSNPSPQKTYFMEFLPEAMDTDCQLSPFKPRPGKQNVPLIPEVEVYLHLLLLIYLIDKGLYEEATKCSNLLMDRLSSNKRTMSLLASRCFFYHSRSYELIGRLSDIRPFLHARLSSATLHGNTDSQAVLINLLLRNYLHYQLYDQASKLVLHTNFPATATNNEWARYLSYVGRIKAIQLDYAKAHQHLVSALRKAPQRSAVGFKQSLHKLNTVVELLLGEQPDRVTFRQADYKLALEPYFKLTQAIHAGDLPRFNEILRSYTPQFASDGTYTLIIRLHHNVIKTAVKRISLSYSRISLVDIAAKLQLDSPEDAEYIVAKAIHDRVIDATIDNGYVKTNETLDLYSTNEPFNQYNKRVHFCLDVRNHAVRAMRYPPKRYADTETAEERWEREQMVLESTKEMSEDDFDGFP